MVREQQQGDGGNGQNFFASGVRRAQNMVFVNRFKTGVGG